MHLARPWLSNKANLFAHSPTGGMSKGKTQQEAQHKAASGSFWVCLGSGLYI